MDQGVDTKAGFRCEIEAKLIITRDSSGSTDAVHCNVSVNVVTDENSLSCEQYQKKVPKEEPH